MNLAFTQDHDQFREMVARFLGDKFTPSVIRELMATETGFDAALWQQLCQELGLAGIVIPEQYGGSGFGAVELGIVMEEMGRYLYTGPYLSSAVMSTYAILNVATEEQKEQLLPDIATGQNIVSLVLNHSGQVDDWGDSIQCHSDNGHSDNYHYRLTGQARFVVDGLIANAFVVAAGPRNGVSLYYVAADARGVTRQGCEVLDPTRKLAAISFSNTPVMLLGSASEDQISLLHRQISIALAHEMVGGASTLLYSTVEYCKLRVQFGRSISSFQALKHRCADMLLSVELARSAAYYAAHDLAGEQQTTHAAYLAKSMAAEVYTEAAKMAVQLHGGIGFTWENDTHLWFKRAKSSEVFLGSPAYHREQMMKHLEELSQ